MVDNPSLTVEVKKHTDLDEAYECIKSSILGEAVLSSPLKEIYRWEHSISRSQIFSVQLYNVFSFVSVHLVRHVTLQPYVTSRREDRGGTGEEGRYTLINHRILCNAEALLDMARRRLCYKSSQETRQTMLSIKEAIRQVDPDLSYWMVPNCVYRGGICPEPRSCGNYRVRKSKGEEDELVMRV